jgi:hypothetical protein
MPALLTELIDKLDSSEIVRDQLAALIKVESEAQEALATAAGKDPRLWKLRVFLERSNPWAEFQQGEGDESVPAQIDATPIVNVWFEGDTFDKGSSNTFERQKAVGVFNIDCYGYGVSAEADVGHIAGDEAAAKEAQRAVRLVRNIIMSAHYTYLGLPRGSGQIVWQRWPQSITVFQPQLDGKTVQHIVGARLALEVEFTEFAPQIVAQNLELLFVHVKRMGTGEIYFSAQYPAGD